MKGGAPPQVIYAHKKTGRLGVQGLMDNWPEEARREWEKAIDEYFKLEDDTKKGPKGPKSDGAPEAPAELRTPAEWAEKLGLVTKAHPHIPQVPTFADWRHAAADKLHGWSDHAYHHQGERARFVLSRDDYQAALKAAAEFPCCPPHGPALPESQRKRFEEFTPRAKRNKKKSEEATR